MSGVRFSHGRVSLAFWLTGTAGVASQPKYRLTVIVVVMGYRGTERTCIECGKTFKGENLRCGVCRATERTCDGCGKAFKGRERQCWACRNPERVSPERACAECGRVFEGRRRRCHVCPRACEECGQEFRGASRRCSACTATKRTCADCGKMFKGNGNRCPACVRTERACVVCGKAFKGSGRRCRACYATERTCTECGRAFKGDELRCGACVASKRVCAGCGETFEGRESRCGACRVTERVCGQCGRTFKGHGNRCQPCQVTERTCIDCGKVFTGIRRRCSPCWRNSLPQEERKAQEASAGNARRARKLAAEVAGPVPPEVYKAIRASGACVYCAASATTVDHVWPLARGGWEHEDNLVPACEFCNMSKGPRLLTEWGRADRVAHGVAHSPKVAEEWARLGATCGNVALYRLPVNRYIGLMTNPNDEFPEVRLSDVLGGDGFPDWGPRTELSDAVIADGLDRIREQAEGLEEEKREQARTQRRVAREVSAAWDRMTNGQETI